MQHSALPPVEQITDQLLDFMERRIYPNEARYHAELAALPDRFSTVPLMEELKAEARAAGLWNLWMPADHGGLSNVDYCGLAEIMGRVLWSAEVFNCSAPDTGNMEILERYAAAGVSNILALRGDPPPESGGRFEPHPQGYKGAADLVAGLKARHPFDISVAAYPECHPDSADAAGDLDNLKRKLDAGATRAITQFVYDTDAVLRFADRAYREGIRVPIVPGIMPISNLGQVSRMAHMSGAEVPTWVVERMEKANDDLDAAERIGVDVAEPDPASSPGGEIERRNFVAPPLRHYGRPRVVRVAGSGVVPEREFVAARSELGQNKGLATGDGLTDQ